MRKAIQLVVRKGVGEVGGSEARSVDDDKHFGLNFFENWSKTCYFTIDPKVLLGPFLFFFWSKF